MLEIPGDTLEVFMKLNGKDLINVGVFSALYFVVTMAVAMLGFIPIFIPLLIVFVPIVGGIPMMLYISKIHTFGMMTLTGLICGILMMLTGMQFFAIATGLVFGFLADVLLKKADYKSIKNGVLAYGIFSMWLIGNYIPMVVTRESYYQMLIDGYGQAYADQTMSYVPAWMLAVLAVAGLVSGLIGGVIGKRMFKKHFERAGMV
jgi:hypothetical protein